MRSTESSDPIAFPFPPSPSPPQSPSYGNCNHSPGRVARPPRPRSPIKLTPLEKKERDRQLKKDQAKKRLQSLHDRDIQARSLQAAQSDSSQWHKQERLEEELILRRLERDLVDPQRSNPVAAGYRFHAAMDAHDTTIHSPVFLGYSPALCPPSQAVSAGRHHTEAACIHPAFTAHCITKHNDATTLSPVFFFVRYNKIPLEEIDLQDNDEDEDAQSSNDDEVSELSQAQFLARQQTRDSSHVASIATLTPAEQLHMKELLRGRFLPSAKAQCLVCQGQGAMGCPGCFSFNQQAYHGAQNAASTRRLKTPKTHLQENYEYERRHHGLRLQLMGFGQQSNDTGKDDEPVVVEQQRAKAEEEDGEEEENDERAKGPSAVDERNYYMNVLANGHASRKHRTVMKNYVVLHIKTIPVGNLISLQVDLRASISYVYELYRSNIDNANRKIHILLPTTAGLFYLNETIELATDTRCGLVNGDFLLEDFHLRGSHHQPPSPAKSPLRNASITAPYPEFLLFSVAILSDTNTPQLVTNFLTQNFHFDEEVESKFPDPKPKFPQLRIEYATLKLPKGKQMASDLYQQKLIPHVHQMKEFTRISKILERQEHAKEKEKVLWNSYQEKKLAKLQHQKKMQNLKNQNGGGDGHQSRKILRAISYLDFVLETTSNKSRKGVWEERLEKLWQCGQLLEEWKICKNGRLLDAENTSSTRKLVQKLLEASAEAFDHVLGRGPGSGPLLYPIQCVGSSSSSSTRRLVVKLGLRLGCSAAENYEHGLVLELDKNQEEQLEGQAESADPGVLVTQLKRGFTKKQLQERNEEQQKRQEISVCWRASDWEWKPRGPGGDSTVLLFTGSDLIRAPFLQFNWKKVVLAYKYVLQSLAFQNAKLENYNNLAKIVQQEDAILSKTQIEKWQKDVVLFHQGLMELATTSSPKLTNSMLLRAVDRVLAKKGFTILKKRLRMRKQEMQKREQELEILHHMQEENKKPKVSMIQQMKNQFIIEKAPQINALLELTPAEKLKQRADQLLGFVTAKATSVAVAAKKEYAVRTL